MSLVADSERPPGASLENATRVAVVGALSATTMLFASLVSAYLVRRSFADWRAAPALWPFALLAFAVAASAGIEVASRSTGTARRRGFQGLAFGTFLYLAGAIMVIVSIARDTDGLGPPNRAFAVMLLGTHVVHAILGAAFSAWALRVVEGGPGAHSLALARLVTHFLTALLFAIVLVLCLLP
jgi:heme/copper-type cytochrome/quinol oxidase subunit 3